MLQKTKFIVFVLTKDKNIIDVLLSFTHFIHPIKNLFPKKKTNYPYFKKKKNIQKTNSTFLYFWSNQNASDTHSIDYPYVFWDKNKDFFSSFLLHFLQENVLNGIELWDGNKMLRWMLCCKKQIIEKVLIFLKIMIFFVLFVKWRICKW